MLSADAKAVRNLGTALRRADTKMYRAVQVSLRVVGSDVARRAKANASWSSRIPATVKARASGVNTVIVSAGGQAAPDAKPFEHAGAEGTFRHPVFGNRDVWVEQAARPFLHPAALERLTESAQAVRDALVVQVEKTLHGQDVFV